MVKLGSRIWREVVGSDTDSPTNNPHPGYPCTLWLHLSCGHEVRRKMSQGVPRRAACPICEEKING